MGPYCRYCDRRCFVPRVLRDGSTMLLATCGMGVIHDDLACGETYMTARNPMEV
jgi:hypothetical protein